MSTIGTHTRLIPSLLKVTMKTYRNSRYNAVIEDCCCKGTEYEPEDIQTDTMGMSTLNSYRGGNPARMVEELSSGPSTSSIPSASSTLLLNSANVVSTVHPSSWMGDGETDGHLTRIRKVETIAPTNT